MNLHTFTEIDPDCFVIIALTITQKDTVVFMQHVTEQYTDLDCTLLQLNAHASSHDDQNSKQLAFRSHQSNNEPKKISMQEFSTLTQQAKKVINW